MHYRLASSLLCVAALLFGGCGGGGGGGSSSTAGAAANSGSSSGLGTAFAASAGAQHTAALAPMSAASAPAYVWGDNNMGQVGSGVTGAQNEFAPVSLKASGLPASTAWKAIAAGGEHTLAIRSDNTLWAWGSNFSGQLGDGSSVSSRIVTSPEKIGTATDWQAVAAGDAHSVALSGASTSVQVWTWGQNAAGQLGLSKTATENNRANVNIPTKVTNASQTGGTIVAVPFLAAVHATAIAAGGRHTLLLRQDGGVFSWGDNTSGQLGQIISTNDTLPTQIPAVNFGSITVVAIASGRTHSLAIDTLNKLYAWGANDAGQLGDNTTVSKFAPVQIGAPEWLSVAGGGAHTLAIKTDRSLWAWGSNSDGQLGINSTTDSLVPVQVGTAKNWASVSAGRFHSVAIDLTGKLWVWGRNAEGQLGLGASVASKLTPTQVP